MIILRQKEFTRNEKRAFLELYKATQGFTQAPKGMKAKDIARFNNFAAQLDVFAKTGDKKVLNRDNAKKLFKSLGLSNSAGEVDHVIDKYTNKKALVRLAKIREHQLKNIANGGKTNFLQQEAVANNKLDRLVNRLAKKGEALYNDSSIKFDAGNKYTPRTSNSYMVEGKLNDYAKRNNIKVISNLGGVDGSSSIRTTRAYDPLNHTYKVVKNGVEGYNAIVSKNIDSPVSALAHELGHYKTANTSSGQDLSLATKMMRPNESIAAEDALSSRNPVYRQINRNRRLFRRTARGLRRVADEASASAHGLSMMRLAGANPETMGYARENLNNALGTYTGSTLYYLGKNSN